MGDRFYEQQKQGTRKTSTARRGEPKPKRKLKADWVKDIEKVAGVEMPGLAKTDLKTLETLYGVLNAKTV